MGFDTDMLSISTCIYTKHTNTNVDRWWQFFMSVVLFATMELEADYA